MRDPEELPKEETGAAAFISASNNEHDGRGIIVGVFDTGVDPGAPGLQTTSAGERKMLDIVDCTGSGDVDTTATATADADGCITGLSGRKLTIPASWPKLAADEKYHLGLKAAFELYPRGLAGRIKDKRRKARIDEAQRDAVAKARADVEGSKGGADKRVEEERKARLAVLETLDKEYDDPGPVFDVVTYHGADGVWRVCVETAETGDLAAARLLCPFRLDPNAYAPLDAETLLNYTVDVTADGGRTTICVDAGSHGTHVAGIIGAHFAETPELNGVAPGVQIIGFKIGDTRLGSMETGAALVRALGAAIERKVDVINLSYGEYASVDNCGRFTKMCELAVYKYGIVFVTSAGNNGPALTTGGAPGTSACCIPIGAPCCIPIGGPCCIPIGGPCCIPMPVGIT